MRKSEQTPTTVRGAWIERVYSRALRLYPAEFRQKYAAQMLEFPNYAQYALSTRMARSLHEVTDFLQQLARAARPAATREYAELQAFAGVPLEAWDVAFYAERLQRSRFSVSQEELRPWFALPTSASRSRFRTERAG